MRAVAPPRLAPRKPGRAGSRAVGARRGPRAQVRLPPPPRPHPPPMDARRVELLQRMPVFGALDERALHLLVECAWEVSVPEGGWFFREGDEARSMFVLERGCAIVTRHWRGREFELNRFGPGDCFGEMALMDLYPRSAGVRAIEDCLAIEFGPDEMMRLHEADLEQFALLQMNLGRELSRRLRATDELLFHAAMGEMPQAPPVLRRSQ